MFFVNSYKIQMTWTKNTNKRKKNNNKENRFAGMDY